MITFVFILSCLPFALLFQKLVLCASLSIVAVLMRQTLNPIFIQLGLLTKGLKKYVLPFSEKLGCYRDRSASIILGRSFLATVGAVIDLPRKRVTFTNIGPFCIYPAVPTQYSLHEAALDSNPKRKPKSRRKGDYKGKKAASNANEGIVVKGPYIKVHEETVNFCSSSVDNTPLEYCTNGTTIHDVNKFGNMGDPTITHPELELRGVSTTSNGRSLTAASRPQQS